MAEINRTIRDYSTEDPEIEEFRAAVFRAAKIGQYYMVYTGTEDELGKTSNKPKKANE